VGVGGYDNIYEKGVKIHPLPLQMPHIKGRLKNSFI